MLRAYARPRNLRAIVKLSERVETLRPRIVWVARRQHGQATFAGALNERKAEPGISLGQPTVESQALNRCGHWPGRSAAGSKRGASMTCHWSPYTATQRGLVSFA